MPSALFCIELTLLTWLDNSLANESTPVVGTFAAPEVFDEGLVENGLAGRGGGAMVEIGFMIQRYGRKRLGERLSEDRQRLAA